ncbi:1-acyl-sn-glycerol-3-phosphate acyltransferase epsilon [Trichoplax sp. H2]|nr:1-acyl-sn-glycerol-3-phosphate acyltransferase epsilon [Trichoplax sp. H2]|eukprot:RDD46210.1 1-acyl-sn-glycerol-3-phosphate acyltransferase epsilon [Trichoplax sp. H2]
MVLQSIIVSTRSLNWCVPAVGLLTAAPGYFIAFSTAKMLTCLLPQRFYDKLDSVMYDSYQKLALFFFESYSGADIVISGDKPDGKENVLFISNHQSTMDWVIVDMVAARFGCIGRVRYILKDELKFIPLYGLYFRQHGCLYLKRQKQWNREKFIRQLDSYKETKIPLWLVVFPEGTRFNITRKDVLEKSQNYALDLGLPVLSQVLTPRTKATEVSMERLGEYFDAVYDITIAYTDDAKTYQQVREPAPSMGEFFNNPKRKLHIYLQRYATKDIPKDEESRKKWIYDLFCKKERLLEDMVQNGRFPGPVWSGPFPILYTLPHIILSSASLYFILSNNNTRKSFFYFTIASMFLTPVISYFAI